MRAEHAQAAARGGRLEDRVDEGKVRHDRVAPGESLAEKLREQQPRSQRGRRGSAKVRGEPEGGSRQRVAAVLGDEAQHAPIDVLFVPSGQTWVAEGRRADSPLGPQGIHEHL